MLIIIYFFSSLGAELNNFGASSLLEMISLEPRYFGKLYAPHVDRLKPLLAGTRAETREIIAKIAGLLSSELLAAKLQVLYIL